MKVEADGHSLGSKLEGGSAWPGGNPAVLEFRSLRLWRPDWPVPTRLQPPGAPLQTPRTRAGSGKHPETAPAARTQAEQERRVTGPPARKGSAILSKRLPHTL